MDSLVPQKKEMIERQLRSRGSKYKRVLSAEESEEEMPETYPLGV